MFIPPARHFVGFVLFVTALPAQMSGTYTLDPNGTGSRNFKDFPNATYQLFVQGVSGPVTIEVTPGTYKQSWSLAPIKGVSATNTVTFKSKMPLGAKLAPRDTSSRTITIADYSPNYPVAWVVLDGFEFVPDSTSETAIYVLGTALNIEVKNCRFSGTLFNLTPSGTNQIDGWQIHHNRFDVPNPRTALYITRSAAIDIYNNDFRCDRTDNVILKTGTYAGTTKRSRIYNNVISGIVTGNRAAIQVDHSADIDHNTVVLDAIGNVSAYCVVASGLLGRQNEYRNNIFVNFTKGPAMYLRGTLKSFEWFANANIYYAPNSTVGVIYQQTPANATAQFTSLSSWQQASGEDKDSMFTDPKLVGGTNVPDRLKLQKGSPAAGAAKNTRSWITTDFAGISRPSPASIGAFEGGGTSTFVPFGKGCPGTFNNVPKIGFSGKLSLGSADFGVTLTNALGSAKTVFAIGLSKTKIGSVSLPIAFGGGCNLLTSSDLLLQLVTGGSGPGNGTASVKFRIPNSQGLKGAQVHFQWAVVDPAAKGIGLAFSDGATVTL